MFYVFQFGIFASGLEGLIGTAEEASEQAEDTVATAGISLDLMGVSLRPITFFEGGVGSLLSAVWSAPSELTSALQVSQYGNNKGHLHFSLERCHTAPSVLCLITLHCVVKRVSPLHINTTK